MADPDRLTAGQQRVVDLRPGPARVTGGFGTGRTAALAARAVRLAERGEPVLALLANRGAARRFEAMAQEAPRLRATTFVDLALELIRRHEGPTGLVDGQAQRNIVAILLEDGWPDPSVEVTPEFSREVADAVLHYQASFLGAEELRVHADAAGELERWDALAGFAQDYHHELLSLKAVDWAGALVRASLLLRDPVVAEAERERYPHVLVDDYETASFASNRLLVQLCGPDHDLVVAGNAQARLDDAHGGSPRYLADLGRRLDLGPDSELVLDRVVRPPVEPHPHRSAIGAEADLAAGLAGAGAAVLVPDTDPVEADRAVAALAPAMGPGIEVVPVDQSVGREWPVVVVTGVVPGRFPAPMPTWTWFDRALLSGPDVPDDDERRARWNEHERSRFSLACSRATAELHLVVSG